MLDDAVVVRGAMSSPLPKPPMSLADVVRALLSHIWLIVLSTFGVTALTAFLVTQIEPVYRAEATILLDPSKFNIMEFNDVVRQPVEASAQQWLARSQADTLMSGALARKVIEKENLLHHGSFAATPSMLDHVADIGRGLALLAQTGSAQAEREGAAVSTPEQSIALADVTTQYLKRLAVWLEKETFVLHVTFEANDAATAARIANAHAQAFVDMQTYRRVSANSAALASLQNEIDAQQKVTAASAAAVQEYRRRYRIPAAGDSVVVTERMRELNRALAEAEDNLTTRAARERQVAELADQSRADLPINEVLGSELIQQLRIQLIALQHRDASEANNLGARHPLRVELRQQIEELENRLRHEVAQIAAGVQSEARVARTRVDSLKEDLDQLATEQLQLESAKVTVNDLERKAEVDRSVLEALILRSKELSVQRNLEVAAADQAAYISTPAREPQYPSFPRNTLFVAFAFLASLTASSGFAVHRAQNSSRILGSKDVAAAAGVACIGSLPEVRRTRPSFPLRYMDREPYSRFAEGVRGVHAYLDRALHGSPGCKCVLVTSALPNEGKSTVSTALAFAMALSGYRTLLVDADLRQQGISRLFGLERAELGLTSILIDKRNFADAVTVDPAVPFSVLPVGPLPAVYGGFRQQDVDLLRMLACGHFDRIVIDSAPWTAVADAAALAPQADGVLLVARWNSTPVAILSTVAERLAATGAKVVGVVVSRVNLRSRSRFSTGEAEYYHRRNGSYYLAGTLRRAAQPSARLEAPRA